METKAKERGGICTDGIGIAVIEGSVGGGDGGDEGIFLLLLLPRRAFLFFLSFFPLNYGML